MEDVRRRMRQEMGTSRVVNDDDRCNEIGDTVTVSPYSFIDYTLLMEPDRAHLQGF
jgi:hypothetical protein